ncbi:hypothetical protein HER10_EVM0000859 [Colletotrichum scovillei]|uniref:uncharacterized protein n=1 Tax=Colletotrichum scovillei TaxID=1209932 RepID=UPI0015C3E66E|nr:uncharacterized protein HER10_EVM0000859 [Colletotrichum scovillei]KAF4779087.1 hypothetical protein HER10_EVM0000859 [Colletotrichum scovillei]
MGSTTTNPIATITNNSGYDVDMYDVFNPSTDPKTPGPLTYTLLGTVPNGTAAKQVPTIHFASQVQAMLTGTIKALNGNYYQQFPVAVLAVSPLADSNAFTITSDTQQSMVDSFKFIKYVQANPSSQLATEFRKALGDKKSQEQAVNDFFKGTGSFQSCTITSWTAVLTWQAQFTNPWQGTYYLYSLGNGSSSNSGTTSGSSAPALVATLAIAASAADCSAVLTIAGTNDENTPVVMAGDGTMQEQNQGTGNTSVALKTSWLNVAQTSQQNGKTVSNYVIGAAFTGTINGVNVAGNLNQLAIPSPSKQSTSANDKNSANGFSLNSLEGLVGMLTSIGMLYYMAKDHKQAETQTKNDVQKEATSKSDAQAREAKVKADYQAIDVPQVQAMSVNVELTVANVQQGYREVGQAQDIQNKQDAVREQSGKLLEVLEAGAPSKATETAAENLVKARSGLEQATDLTETADARETGLTNASATLAETSADIQQALQDEGSQLSQDEEKALKDTREALDKVQEEAKAQEENRKEQEKQDDNDPSEEVDDNQFDNPESADKPDFEGGE